jgi:hypothetical protein
MLSQQSTNCRHYHRFNEWQSLVHSLTRSWYAIPTVEDLCTISEGKWKTGFYSIHLLDHDCCSIKRPPVHNITGWMKDQKLLHSLTRSSYAIPTIYDLSAISQAKWRTRSESIYLLDHYCCAIKKESATISQVERRIRVEFIHICSSLIVRYGGDTFLKYDVFFESDHIDICSSIDCLHEALRTQWWSRNHTFREGSGNGNSFISRSKLSV